jgi:hypothetical protein
VRLTPEIKARIDSLDVYDLLERARRAPIGDPMFQDEVGEYWMKRLAEKRNENNAAYVAASKAIGWW